MKRYDVAVIIALIFYVAWRVDADSSPWYVTAIACSAGIVIGSLIVSWLIRWDNRRRGARR